MFGCLSFDFFVLFCYWLLVWVLLGNVLGVLFVYIFFPLVYFWVKPFRSYKRLFWSNICLENLTLYSVCRSWELARYLKRRAAGAVGERGQGTKGAFRISRNQPPALGCFHATKAAACRQKSPCPARRGVLGPRSLPDLAAPSRPGPGGSTACGQRLGRLSRSGKSHRWFALLPAPLREMGRARHGHAWHGGESPRWPSTLEDPLGETLTACGRFAYLPSWQGGVGSQPCSTQ